MGQYKEAYAIYEVHNAMKDTMNTEESKNIALKAEFQHETDKKQAAIRALEQENRIKSLQNWGLIGGLLAVVANWLFPIYAFQNQKTKQNNKNTKITIQTKKAYR